MSTPKTYANGIRAAASLVRDAGPADEGQQLLLKVLADSLLTVADSAERDEVRMSTGRIDLDHKSDRERWDAGVEKYGPDVFGRAVNVEMAKGQRLAEAIKNADLNIERERLRDAVVEAAALRRRDQNAMFQQGTKSACDVFTAADSHFESSLTALLEFEAKQDQKD